MRGFILTVFLLLSLPLSLAVSAKAERVNSALGSNSVRASEKHGTTAEAKIKARCPQGTNLYGVLGNGAEICTITSRTPAALTSCGTNQYPYWNGAKWACRT